MNNPHEAIISIKPKYADAILSGRKTVELRRRIPPIEIGSRLWIYATRPKAAIVGSVTLEKIVSLHPDQLWEYFGDQTEIDRNAYDLYFGGTSIAMGLFLSDAIKIEPIELDQLREKFGGFHPPQVLISLTQNRKRNLSALAKCLTGEFQL